MRTRTAAQTNQIGLAHRSTHLRVRADPGGGAFVDLTDLENRCFVESATYGPQLDKPIGSAVIKVRRESYDLSLSPLHDTSKLNVGGTPVSIGNPIIVETATLAKDQKPVSTDFVEVFRGEIDDIDLGKPAMTLKCRDGGGRLVDHFAEDQQIFPVQALAADNQMEDVIQDVVDYHNEFLANIGAVVTWDGTLTATLSSTTGLSVGDFVGIRGTTNASAFFPIASIVTDTSFTITNPQSRTVPTATAVSSQRIPAASRRTLYSPAGSSSVPFNGADAPGFQLNKFKNEKEAILPFIRRVALLIGWDVGYRWQETVGAFELQLIGPERALASQGALTFTATVPLNNETFVVNATTFTAKTSGAATDEWDIGADGPANALAVVAMFNAGTEKDNALAFVDPDNSSRVIFAWATLGAAGESVTFTEALTGTTADGAGTLGGTQAGTDGPAAADWTFNPNRYRDVTALKISRKDIRNVIRVTYVDPITNDRVTVIRSDSSSIAKYGRRYAEFTEDAALGIDTIAEAIDFADAALADLREPDIDQQVTHEYFWPVQINDTLTYEANGRHYTSDQTLSVVAVKHSLKSNGDDTTVITVSGKPAGGRKRWFDIEGRRGIAPPIDAYSDAAPTGVVLQPSVGMVTLTLDDPRTADPPMLDWKTTRVHMQAGTSDFTVGPGNLEAEGRQLRFEIGGLLLGNDYTFKVVNVDEAGNNSTASTFVSEATQHVGPYHENPNTQGPQLNRNWDLNVFTLGTGSPPDFWEVFNAGSWGSEVDVTITDTATGANAITIDTTAAVNPGLRSDLIPISPNEGIKMTILGKVSTGSHSMEIRAEYIDDDKTTVNGTLGMTFTFATSFELRSSPRGFVNNDVGETKSRYIRIYVLPIRTSVDFTTTIDRFHLTRAPGLWSMSKTFTQSLVQSTWTTVDWNSIDTLGGCLPSIVNDETVINFGGLWDSWATITFGQVGTVEVRLQEDTGGGYTTFKTASASSATAVSIAFDGPRKYEATDKIRVQARSSNPTPTIIVAGTTWYGEQESRDDAK